MCHSERQDKTTEHRLKATGYRNIVADHVRPLKTTVSPCRKAQIKLDP